MTIESQSELGKKSAYETRYNPALLFPIPRVEKRREIGIDSTALPFHGFDLWNHYEVSWLNEKGKPVVAMAEIIYDCRSPAIIESKSLKLYFNSLNNSVFKDISQVENTITRDLEQATEYNVLVTIHAMNSKIYNAIDSGFKGICLDDLDIDCTIYTVDSRYLSAGDEDVSEELYSNLLKSNCLVTNQPDWGSLYISYKGKKINRDGLLKYIISFRNHNEFHEQCVERIFVDIMTYCRPEELTVYARYTRRGGIDINPCRSTKYTSPDFHRVRLVRQ